MADKMTDSDIAAVLLYQIGRAVGTSDSRLSKERENTFNYYDGSRPHPMTSGDAPYYSLDVYDGVEAMKSQLLETFSGNGRPVMFNPQNGEDTLSAQQRTDYVTDVIFNQQEPNGFSILRDVLHDGLMNRAGVVKVWWETKEETEHYDMSDATEHELSAFVAQNPDADLTEYELDEDGTTIKRARLAIKKDRSQVRIKVIPPEQFGIAPMSEDIRTSGCVFHRRYVTNSDLIKEGYPKSKVLALQDNDRLWQSTDPEVIVRFQDTDDMLSPRDQEVPTKARRVCTLYECYMELDLEDSGVSQLYKIDLVGNTVLSKEPVDRKPVVPFIPLPVPHRFFGQNYAAQLIPTQVARTYLTRSIINHALITNNPRLQVVNGVLSNPRELMENRIGGIVNVTRPDGILPIPQAGLNPFVFQTIAMLDEDKEEITGISRLSQGLNKDAISKQNSQGMVNDLISVSQVRQKIIARNFAENFLRDLYMEVYRLVVENEDRQKIVSISGGPWQPIDFTAWPETTTMSVSFTLGYGENEAEAQKWVTFDQMMSKDPGLAPLYPLPKRWFVIKKIMEALGVKNVTDYILTPEQVTPPQPSPIMMADLAVKQADAKVKLANAQAAVQKLALEQQTAQTKATEGVAKMQLETQKMMQQGQIEKAKLAHKIVVDAAEIALEQQAQENDKLTAVAEPTRS